MMADTDEFCVEMRQKTQKIHDRSDKLVNLKLAVVLTDTTLWGHVLADFYFVFQAIETALVEHSAHPCVGPLYFDELRRSESFERDLEFYLGADWRSKVRPSKAAQDYCDRITTVACETPYLLVAYAHSMYLALLAGGQIIKRIVKKTLGLSGNDGLSIFEFDDINKSEIKKKFTTNINRMDLTRDQKDEIIEEKKRVFMMNNKIASNVKPTARSFQRIAKFIFLFFAVLFILFYLLFKVY